MPVLGNGGKLLLKRKAPEACIVSAEAVIPEINSLQSICPGYWNGDHVSTICLPLASDPFPPNPDGYATYFDSRWYLGPNRTQITARDDDFYKKGTEAYPDGQEEDNAQFYCREGDVSGGDTIDGCQSNDYWIHVDALGRVSFYTSRCSALKGCASDRVQLGNVSSEQITISPYGSASYFNAVWQCVSNYGEYQFSDAQDTVTLVSICADAPIYEKPEAGTDEYNNANLLPRSESGSAAPYWQILCGIREWQLDLEAPSVDTTGVDEKFGTAVKSLVNGGGSVEFFIERQCFDSDDQDNGLTLMQLLLMTEKGCDASAEFWMMQGDPCDGSLCGPINGDLYYTADILVTGTAINLRPTELVAGTARFVTTGDIELLQAT